MHITDIEVQVAAQGQARFPIGDLTATGAVADWAIGSRVRLAGIGTSVLRHLTGDWGDDDAHDRATNDYAVTNGERVLSSYTVDGTVLWVLTEADRSVTTVLFPSDY